MDQKTLRERLYGCYVTIPTMFNDDEGLSINLDAMREHVQFLINGGIQLGTGVLLAGGAAGDFSTMTFTERVRVCETVVEAADGRVPVALGAQTTNTQELRSLAKAAERVGAEYIQVSPPFYFSHTAGDVYEYILAASEATEVGLIIYNTFWTSTSISMAMVDKLLELPNVAGLKWSVPRGLLFDMERLIERFSDRVSIVDNNGSFVMSSIVGARSIEIHVANYWPEWAVSFFHLLEEKRYVEAQSEVMRVVVPFHDLWADMMQYTGGDGYLDKLCMELVGLPSSRCRPPTRDVRDQFRKKARRMLIDAGVPGVKLG